MTTSDKRKGKHRVLKYSLYGLLVLVLLLVVAVVLATLPPGENIIKGKLESVLSSRLHQPVTIGTFETNLFTRVRLSDITVHSQTDSDSSADVDIKNILVEYSLWPLVHKEISIKSVLIDTVVVHLLRNKSGVYNLAIIDSLTSTADTSRTPSSGSSFTFRLDSAFMQSLSVDFVDSTLPLRAELRHTHLGVESIDSASGYGFLIRSDSGSLQYGTFPAGPLDISVSGIYTPDAWILDTLHIAVDRMDLAGSGRIVQNDQSPIEASLVLTGNPGRLTEIIAKEFALKGLATEGELIAEARVSGTFTEPLANADIVLPTITYADTKVSNGLLFARLVGDSVFVDSAGMDIFGGRLSASGHILIDTTLSAAAQAGAGHIRLASLWTAFYDTPSPYKGRLDAGFTLGGTGTSLYGWKADGTLRIRNAVYRDEPFSDLDATLALADGILNSAVNQEYLNLQAQVGLRKDSLTGKASLAISDLKPLAGILEQPDLSGSLSADVSISGTYESPRAEARIQGKTISYRSLPVDTVTVAAAYADSQVYVSQLYLTGRLNIADSSQSPPILAPLTGDYSYSGRASGTLDSLVGQFELTTIKPAYGSFQLDSGRVSVGIDGRKIDLDTLSVYRNSVSLLARAGYNLNSGKGTADAFIYNRAAESQADSNGTMPSVGNFKSTFAIASGGNMAIDASGSGIDLGALRSLWPDTIDIAGTIGFEVNFRGDRTNPNGTLSLSVLHPRYKDVLLDSVVTGVSISPDSVDISSFDIFSSDERLAANALLELRRDSLGNPTVTRRSAVSGSISSSNLKLKGFEPFLPMDILVEGLATLNLNWNGTLADPNVRGTVDIRNTQVVLAPQDTVLSSFNLAGRVYDTTISFDTATGIVYGTPFTLDGSATISAGSEIHTDLSMTVAKIATITGKGMFSQQKIDFVGVVDSLDLAVVQPFVPMVDTMSGTLDAKMSVSGSAENPVIDGFVALHRAIVKPGMLNESVTGGTAHITFAGDSLKIDTLTAQLGGGTISLTGQLTHQKMVLTGVNVELKADKVKVSDDKQFTIKVDSIALAYSRKGKDRYQLSGSVDLGSSRLTRNFEFQSILPWANSVKQVNTSLPQIATQTDLDVKIIGGDSLWVDNNIARVRMSADLRAIGNGARPNLTGQVSIREGYLIYLDRRFEVQQGQLYFADPNKLNPDINFLAQANVTTYQATQPMSYVISVSVTGSLEQPVFSLSSEPPLTQSDIVSLLTLGATLSQLSGQGSTEAGSTQQVLLDRAATLGSEQLTGAVTRRLGSLLDLDQLTVQGSLFNQGSAPAPSLLVAKQVTSRVRVTYSTTVGRVNDQNVRLDYRLTNRLSLQSETDQQGNASLSFKYGFKFK